MREYEQSSGMKERHVVHHSCFTIYDSWGTSTATRAAISFEWMCFTDVSMVGIFPISITFFQM